MPSSRPLCLPTTMPHRPASHMHPLSLLEHTHLLLGRVDRLLEVSLTPQALLRQPYQAHVALFKLASNLHRQGQGQTVKR